jgi:O-antigen/teichoic acid export membrane protein
MTWRVGNTVRSFGWGIADQVLSSATNFLMGLLVARTVGPAEFGAFALAYATYTLTLGGNRALALEPLTVRYSAAPPRQSMVAIAAATGTSLVLGIIVGFISLIVAACTAGTLRMAFAVLGLALPGLLVQDAWRFSFFSVGRGEQAFWNDFVWAMILLPAAVFVIVTGRASISTLMAAWAIAGWIAAGVGLAQARVAPRPNWAVKWILDQRDLASRFFAEFVISTGGNQLSFFLIATLTTLAEVGRLRAGQVLLGPLNILFLGAGLVAVAETARFVAHARHRLDEAVWTLSAVLTLGTLCWVGAALLIPASLGNSIMGRNWIGGRGLLVPLATGTIGVALSYGPMTGMRVLAAARYSLRARVLDTATVLILSVTGAAVGGVYWAAWGYALAGCVRIPNFWWHLRAARRHYDSPTAGESVAGPARMSISESPK